MATPSKKHPVVENMLNKFSNRTEAITSDKCLNPPMGCGGPATEFKDELLRKEYTISGWCQAYQDGIFG